MPACTSFVRKYLHRSRTIPSSRRKEHTKRSAKLRLDTLSVGLARGEQHLQQLGTPRVVHSQIYLVRALRKIDDALCGERTIIDRRVQCMLQVSLHLLAFCLPPSHGLLIDILINPLRMIGPIAECVCHAGFQGDEPLVEPTDFVAMACRTRRESIVIPRFDCVGSLSDLRAEPRSRATRSSFR